MWLGSVSGNTLPEGPSFIAPWMGTEEFSTQPHTKVAGGKVMTSDEAPHDAEVQFLFRLNAKLASKVRIHLGSEEKFTTIVENLCQNAVKEGAATLSSKEISTTGRHSFVDAMLKEAQALVKDAFVSNGFTEAEASEVVIFTKPVVKAITPAERIQAGLSERAATLIDKDRQETLTEIATEIAKRREQEGTGIANMLAKIPEGHNLTEVAALINAEANHHNADALNKAVELGKLGTAVFSSAPVTVATK